MMSMPREAISAPSTSALRAGFPPALSVRLSACTAGKSRMPSTNCMMLSMLLPL